MQATITLRQWAASFSPGLRSSAKSEAGAWVRLGPPSSHGQGLLQYPASAGSRFWALVI